jgi:hypothetical protein
MEQTPSWESNSLSVKEIHLLFFFFFFFFGTDMFITELTSAPPLVLIVSHMKLAHTLTPYYFKIHYDIILTSTFR